MFNIVERHPDYFKNKIHLIISEYHKKIQNNTLSTENLMNQFYNEHHQMYELFYSKNELKLMEKYHNMARILSANMGRIFDSIVKFIIIDIEGGQTEYWNNTNSNPKKFEIDVVNNYKKIAYEIKWRDAGTDGDHKSKEFRKVDLIKSRGYTPIRLTFFLPELERSAKAQKDIIDYYSLKGLSYTGKKAFEYINNLAKIDLLKIIKQYNETETFKQIYSSWVYFIKTLYKETNKIPFDLSKEMLYNIRNVDIYKSEGNLSEFL